MYNWAEICSELKDLEKRVDVKISRIFSENPTPFPDARIKAHDGAANNEFFQKLCELLSNQYFTSEITADYSYETLRKRL
nr:hypothetical protein [Algoriphagus sp. 4150]